MSLIGKTITSIKQDGTRATLGKIKRRVLPNADKNKAKKVNIKKMRTVSKLDLSKIPDLKVSVVVPNYNYERYIEDRLNTILNQTIKPYEIIFLDDVSKDGSVDIARAVLEKSGIKHKVIVNTENNGCFRQWLKGINESEGDIVWIAEADDLCEPTFIERLLPFFADDQVNLAYGQSEVINENDERSGFVYSEYTKEFDPEKWLSDYINNGESEIIEGLGVKNTIPNASGVLMRKAALEGIEEYLRDYSISGDWFAYVYLMRIGKIGFCSDVLNYHRRHSGSIINVKEQDIKFFLELMRIKLYVAKTFIIPESIREDFINMVPNEYKRLMPETAPTFMENAELKGMYDEINDILDDNYAKYSFLKNVPKKNIMFVMPDFEMGGGQTLIIRLANYLARIHKVYVYNARPWLYEDRIAKMFTRNVTLLDSEGTPDQLRKYVIDLKIDIVNSHIWWSDKITYQAVGDMDVRHVLAMHGCYEAILEHPDWDPDFAELAPKILINASEVIYATNKNKKIFETVDVNDKIHQIYYGYELESIAKVNKASLGIDEDSFVFGLVARGIESKGFGKACEAFTKLKSEVSNKMDLVLVGNGEYIDGLKTEYASETSIHFADNLNKPSEWIGYDKMFDCAMLPTFFISESLPNSVIEYLAYSKPVISTDIGDIKYMIGDKAGIVLSLRDGTVDADELAEAMKVMVTDDAKRASYEAGATEMFKQFEIKNFIENYYRLF